MFVEQRPSGQWRGGYRHNGRKVTRTFRYEYEAREWALQAESEASAPAAPAAPAAPSEVAPVGPVFDTYAAEWVTRLGHLAKSTRDGYGTHLRAIAASGMGAHAMGTVKRSDVQRWVTAMVDAGVGRPTINARLKVLRMVFRDAVVELVVEHDPTAAVPFLTLDLTTDRVLDTAEDARLIAAAAADPATLAMVLLAMDAGLRWQEAAGLPADAVYADHLVVRQVVERSTGTIRKYPKGHRSRRVPIATPRLRAALDVVLAHTDTTTDREALLFTTADGTPLDYYNFRRVWRPLCRRAALNPRPRFHDLRHTFGTRLAAAGVPRYEIALVMGHADESTTARYMHTGDDGRRLSLLRDALAPAPTLTVVADTTA
jgi:site-specific recombinase XerD